MSNRHKLRPNKRAAPVRRTRAAAGRWKRAGIRYLQPNCSTVCKPRQAPTGHKAPNTLNAVLFIPGGAT